MKKSVSVVFLVLFALFIAGVNFADAGPTNVSGQNLANATNSLTGKGPIMVAQEKPRLSPGTSCQEKCRDSSNSTDSLRNCLKGCGAPTPAK